MKKFALLTILACLAVQARAQTTAELGTGATFIQQKTVAPAFDQDGGLISAPCVGGATNYFYTEEVGGRWWFCTPEGHHLHAQAIANLQVPGINSSVNWGPNVLAKYGGNTNTAAIDTQKKFFTQGNSPGNFNFNTLGELSSGRYPPWSTSCTGCIVTPAFVSTNVSVYATVNLNNLAAHPIKNFIIGLDDYFPAFRGAGCTDVFDPQYQVFGNKFWGQTTQPFLNNLHALGITIDDTDFQCGLGGSAAFDTYPVGHLKANRAYMALVTSPLETLNPGQGNISYQSTPELFTDPVVYEKALSANPPTSLTDCWSLADRTKPPCSVEDRLYAKYGGSIAALNTAWGSTYTGFRSSGTSINGFLCGTGDGITTVFNCTLPTSAGWISPLSVAVFINQSMQAGDCFWQEGADGHCPKISSPAKTPTAAEPFDCSKAGNCMGVFKGDKNSTLKSGFQPWLSNNPCGATGANPAAPHATFTAIVTWEGSGSYIPSRSTSNNCPAGEGDSVISPASPPSGAISYAVYMACKLMDTTTPGFGCVGSNALAIAPTLQASGIPVGTNFVVPTTGVVSGAALPSPPSFIDYGTGQVTLSFGTAPVANAQVLINAMSGGWMWGTALDDEDGHHPWLAGGVNPWCMTAYAGGGIGTPGYGCRSGNPGNYPQKTVNSQVGADLNDSLYQMGARYLEVLNQGLKAANPHMLYFGPNVLGDWGSPARYQLLEVARFYVDVLFSSNLENPMAPSADDAAKRAFTEKHFGDKPMFYEFFGQASADSAVAGKVPNNDATGYPSQSARGAGYYNSVFRCLNDISINSTFQCIGDDWWGGSDFNTSTETNNWGLVTPDDNDYDGVEPAATAVPCTILISLPCGNQSAPLSPGVRPFGNAITQAQGVITANQLWWAIASGGGIVAPAPPSGLTATPH